MDNDVLIRRVLRVSAVFNFGGALLFAFPDSVGRLGGLPSPVPAVYSILLGMFVLLFGGAYAWLARQPEIDRPMVGLAAIGKAAAFVVALGCWLFGAVALRTVVLFAGDLVLAGIFAWWLLEAAPASATSRNA